VNDGIPKDLCILSYITIDTALEQICTIGPGTLLAKIDIKSAFRLLPVHPADRHLLAMKWKKQLYIDTCLPFGLRSAPKLFNILADLLSCILENVGVLHYLDDFLTLGSPDTLTCSHNLQIIKGECQPLGVPLALEKVEGPSESLMFLGILLDTKNMEAHLPLQKLRCIRSEVATWLVRRKATKRQILSLVGLLQHATKVVKPGRMFIARMYRAAARLKNFIMSPDFPKVSSQICGGGTYSSQTGMESASSPSQGTEPPLTTPSTQTHPATGDVAHALVLNSSNRLVQSSGQTFPSWLKN